MSLQSDGNNWITESLRGALQNLSAGATNALFGKPATAPPTQAAATGKSASNTERIMPIALGLAALAAVVVLIKAIK
jgi:hypothetical protein